MEGQVLGGRYEMGERLGAPGRRAVWTAYDRQDGRTVAVQVLVGVVPASEELDRAAESLRTFAERVDDTHLLVVRDLGPVDGGLFVVTDHVVGRGLDEVLAAEGTPAPAVAVDRARQVCAGLAAAHGAGLAHGDLRPANLLVTADGTVKLMDLGGAGLRPAPGNDGAGGGDTALAGVPWMAPERVRGGEQADDHRSDLYALGCVLYQLLTGTTPFGHREVTLQFGAHLRETPAPPSRHRPGLPAGLDALVLGLLAKDPEDRPQSAAEVAAQLGGLAVETAAVAGPGAPGFPAEAAVVAVAPAAPVAVVAIEPVAVWSAADFHGAHPDDRRPGRRRAALVAGTTALAVALVAGAVWAAAGRPAGTVGPARPAAAAADAPAGAEDPGTDPADSGLTAGSASAAPGGSGAPTGSGSAGPSGSAAATGASTAPPATAGPGPAAGATTAPGSTAPAGAPGTTPARPPASPGTAAAAYGCTGGLVGSYPVATGAGVVLGYYYVFFDNAKGTNCAATIKTSDSGYGTASAVSATISRCTQTAPAASCTKVAGTTATDSGSYKMYAGPVKVAAVATCITGYGSITWGGVTATTAKSLGNRAVHCA